MGIISTLTGTIGIIEMQPMLLMTPGQVTDIGITMTQIATVSMMTEKSMKIYTGLTLGRMLPVLLMCEPEAVTH
jgi:hypothetical protein